MKCTRCYIFAIFITVISCRFVEKRNLKQDCGVQKDNNYPWVAFIPLQTRTFNPDAKVECVGALISERYVITSSSCLQFVVSKIQFWWNLQVVEVEVEKWIAFQATNIALLKLANDVEFSEFLRPICLPSDDMVSVESTAASYYTATWMSPEKNTTGRVKQLVESAVVNCERNNEGYVCLRPSEGTAICNKDEGSPIMYSGNNKWTLYGVLNYALDVHKSLCDNTAASGSKITNDVLKWIMHVMEKY